MTDPFAPIAIVDRDMIVQILDEHIAKHMRYEIDHDRMTLGSRNPFPISREGLQHDLINYVSMVRRGEVPVEGAGQ